MKRELMDQNSAYLKFQRNIFAALVFLLTVAIILLCIFLFLKRERIVVTPPFIEKEFWVEGKKVSPTYLEQYGYFLCQLLLGKSCHSAPTQRAILMRHTAPSFAGDLRNKLVEEEEMLKRQNAVYTFFPIAVHANPEKNEVLIEGDRVFFVSGKQISSEKEGYILNFHYSGSRLLLSGVRASKNKENQCTK